MLKEFHNLTPAEQQLMLDAIPLITILVAGADDDIDEVEIAEAQRLADIRSFNKKGQTNAYYEKVDNDLTGRIMEMMKELPNALAPRQEAIVAKLSGLNDVFAKMDEPFGYLYYKSFCSFAKHVAESHGGFLRFMTVGPKEAEVVNLPMLNAVERPSKIDYPNLP
ncbi:hypothetical protein [Neolewinella persica]|uniref:hypothetical protein n=1 Tax=Neolewinella persica TaxID=70998 RepID=UPI00036BB778|nr:hypothetical protein [Neolewinella persica]